MLSEMSVSVNDYADKKTNPARQIMSPIKENDERSEFVKTPPENTNARQSIQQNEEKELTFEDVDEAVRKI